MFSIKTVMKERFYKIAFLLLVMAALNACSGGGSGDDTSPTIAYVGNSNAAVLSTTNASEIIANVIGGGSSVQPGTPVSFGRIPARFSQSDNTHKRVFDLSRWIAGSRELITPRGQDTKNARVLAASISETQLCNQGAFTVAGTIDDEDGTGKLYMVFDDCVIDGVLTNGPATFDVEKYDFSRSRISAYTLYFSDLTFIESGIEINVSGNVHSETLGINNTETLKFNIVSVNNVTGEQVKSDNLVITIKYDDLFSLEKKEETITGRVFHSVHGYVDVSTTSPLSYGDDGSLNASSGEVLFAGAGGSKIFLNAEPRDLIVVEMDIDGDDLVDIEAYLKWSDLVSEIGSDLKDTDKDGMHDSWEVAYGLDPFNSMDAGLDRDADSVTNLVEYKNATSPSSVSSVPSVTDLSVELSTSAESILTGRDFQYTISVRNLGMDDAGGVTVRYIVPAGLTVKRIFGDIWQCSQPRNVLVCDREVITSGSLLYIFLDVSVDNDFVGDFTNTITVSSSVSDTDESNNRFSMLATAQLPLSNLSASIAGSANQVGAEADYEYKVSVRNDGPDDAVNVLVTIALPAYVGYRGVSGNHGWSCDNVNNAIHCSRDSFMDGAQSLMTVYVTAPNMNIFAASTVTIDSATTDSDPGNNSSSETTEVIVPSDSLDLDFSATVHDVEYDSVRELLYVSIPETRQVAILSSDSLSEINRISLRASPYGIDISQDNSVLYIALFGGGAVARLDLETLLVTEIDVSEMIGATFPPGVPDVTGREFVYDVLAVTNSQVFVSAYGSLTYVVKIDVDNNDVVTRVASDEIIREKPFLLASPDQTSIYVTQGFYPNSLYKLDITQLNAPIIHEDDHGSLLDGGYKHLDVTQDGARLFLASGQVLDADTLDEVAQIDEGVSKVSNDGAKIYLGRQPNLFNILDSSSYQLIETIASDCDISEIKRILEIDNNSVWVIMGQENLCRVSRD